MSTTITELKQINEKTQMIVFGYIREMQSKLSLCNMPIMISYLCLAFHSHGEYFDEYSDRLQVSNDQMTVKRIKTICKKCRDTTYPNDKCYECSSITATPRAFGHQIIPSHSNIVAKWTFKIIDIGNDRKYKHIQFQLFRYNKINNHSSFRMEFDDTSNVSYVSHYGIKTDAPPTLCRFIKGDIVKIILNTKDKRVYVKINDNKLQSFFKNLPIGPDQQYRIAVTLNDKDDAVSLIDFQQSL